MAQLSDSVGCLGTNDLWRRSQWSPDRSLILAQTDSHALYIYEVSKTFTLRNVFKSPSPILDVVWYQLAAGSGGYEWCFAVSARDVPVRLVNATSGKTLASYTIINHIEEVLSPNSLAFSRDAYRMYAGLYNAVAIIPLSSPGTNVHVTLDIGSSYDDPRAGQRGVVSTIAVGRAPLALEASGEPAEIIAVGTFSGDVGIYVVEPSWVEPLIEQHRASRHGSSRVVPGGALCLAGWHMSSGAGIQQLVFHPEHQHLLFVSTRRSSHIHVLDTRYLYGMAEPFHFARLGDEAKMAALLERNTMHTHQRTWIDISDDGKYVASGDEDGIVRIWNCMSLDNQGIHLPIDQWNAAQDTVASAIFGNHNTIVTASGGRHWFDTVYPQTIDAALRLWQLNIH